MNEYEKIEKMDDKIDALSNKVAVLEARILHLSNNVKDRMDRVSDEITLARGMITDIKVNVAKVSRSTKIIWALIALAITGGLTFVGNLLVKLL